MEYQGYNELEGVSVPIRGLFNLTEWEKRHGYDNREFIMFPSPSGDYLI